MNVGLALRAGLFDSMMPIILDDDSKAGRGTSRSRTERMGLNHSKTSEFGSKSNTAAARPFYRSMRTSSGVTSESSFSSAQSPPPRDPLDMDFFPPISRNESVATPPSHTSTTSLPLSVRTNGTTLPPAGTIRDQAKAIFGELPRSEPGSIAAALDLIKFVGVERADDVSVCLRTLSPFLSPVEAGETGRGRDLLEGDLRGEAQKHIYRVIKLYATNKMKTKVLSRRQGKSKEDVGRKLDLLEVQFATADMLELFSLVRRVLDLSVGHVRASDDYSTRPALDRSSSSTPTTATASTDNAGERLHHMQTSPLATPSVASETSSPVRNSPARGLFTPAQTPTSQPRSKSPFSSWTQPNDFEVVDEEDAPIEVIPKPAVERLQQESTPIPRERPVAIPVVETPVAAQAPTPPSSKDALVDAIRLLQENGLISTQCDASALAASAAESGGLPRSIISQPIEREDPPLPPMTGRSQSGITASTRPVRDMQSLLSPATIPPPKVAIASGPSPFRIASLPLRPTIVPEGGIRAPADPGGATRNASLPLRQRHRMQPSPIPPKMPLPPVPGVSEDDRDATIRQRRVVVDMSGQSNQDVSPRTKRRAVFLDGETAPVMISEVTLSRLRSLYEASSDSGSFASAAGPAQGVKTLDDVPASITPCGDRLTTTIAQDAEAMPTPTGYRAPLPLVEEDEDEFVFDDETLGDDDRFSTLFFNSASMWDTGSGSCRSSASAVDGGVEPSLWTPVIDATDRTEDIEEGSRTLSEMLGMEIFGAQWADDETDGVKEHGSVTRPRLRKAGGEVAAARRDSALDVAGW